MRSLIWQQWRESRALLALLMTWMLLATLHSVAYEIGHRFRAPVGHFGMAALFQATCAAIVLGMRASQGERAAGTLPFSAALPVSIRRIATARIVCCATVLAIPILVGAVLLALALASGLVHQVEPRDELKYVPLQQRDTAPVATALEQLAGVTAISIVAGIELMLVVAAIGCRLRTPSRVGLVGAVLAFASMSADAYCGVDDSHAMTQVLCGAVFPQSLMVFLGYSVEHGGYVDPVVASRCWIALMLATPILILLGSLFVTQYGRLRSPASDAKPTRHRFRMPSLWSHLPLHLPGRLAALVWLDLRQSGPLVVAGLAFALLITLATPRHSAGGVPVLAALPHSACFVGMLWAAVVGSAIYSAELESGLGGFWRSRPIATTSWFWCKFLVGLAAVLLVLDGVTIVATWYSTTLTMQTGMSWTYVGTVPILHALMYALAVLGTCWLRKPVVGAFVAILAYMILNVAVGSFASTYRLEPFMVYNSLLLSELAGTVDFTKHGYPLVYGTLAASVVILGAMASRLATPLMPASGRWVTRR
jgi:ABC-type transport system involved in multi-copper enzyme maturation permease subunit